MPIIVPGIECPLCGQGMQEADDILLFPRFVNNEADPLCVFSDCAVHAACFDRHPLSGDARARYAEFREHSDPNARLCSICLDLISDPDDYLALGRLSADPNDELYHFNYAQFHRSCLSAWSGLEAVLRELDSLDRSGSWKGPALKWLIAELRKAERSG